MVMSILMNQLLAENRIHQGLDKKILY